MGSGYRTSKEARKKNAGNDMSPPKPKFKKRMVGGTP